MPKLLLALMLALLVAGCASEARERSGGANSVTCEDGRAATLGQDAYRDAQGKLHCNPQ